MLVIVTSMLPSFHDSPSLNQYEASTNVPSVAAEAMRFYECHIVRHSVMLVGMPFSGKTTALNCLQKTLTDLAHEGIMHAGCAVHQAGLVGVAAVA